MLPHTGESPELVAWYDVVCGLMLMPQGPRAGSADVGGGGKQHHLGPLADGFVGTISR